MSHGETYCANDYAKKFSISLHVMQQNLTLYINYAKLGFDNKLFKIILNISNHLEMLKIGKTSLNTQSKHENVGHIKIYA